MSSWADPTKASDLDREMLRMLADASYTEVHPWEDALRGRAHLQDNIREVENRSRVELVYEPSVVPGPPQTAGYARRLVVLGSPALWRDGLRVGLGPPRRVAALTLLAVQPSELVRRDAIVEALWEQRPPAAAANLVQAHVSRLRRVLDPGGRTSLIEQGAGGYRLRAGAAELATAAFAELASRASKAAATGNAAAAYGLFAQALGLWRGKPDTDTDGLHGHLARAALARIRANAVLGPEAAASRRARCPSGWRLTITKTHSKR